MEICDVAIIGAGPYGLSAAAHLRALDGLRVRIFGEPMSFWERHMPAGMLLRSPWVASHLSDPARALTLDAYRNASGNHLSAPVPLRRFVDYGRWFQSQTMPHVDERQVTLLEQGPGGFLLTLADGEVLKARRTVVAAGIAPFAFHPEEFRDLPRSVVSHTSEEPDLARFASRHVVVVGAGQSALESAVLLHEGGASVEMVVREPQVRWLWQRPLLHKWPLRPLLYAWPDVGPAGLSHLVARPSLFRKAPRWLQDQWGVRSVRPAGAAWVKKRFDFEKVAVRTGRSVVGAFPEDGGVLLRFDDGTKLAADHVLLGTGYRVDIAQYRFLGRTLLASVRQTNGYPQLGQGLESSVPGLHFLGAAAAWSFGPLMRFVAGAEFACRALVRRVARTR